MLGNQELLGSNGIFCLRMSEEQVENDQNYVRYVPNLERFKDIERAIRDTRVTSLFNRPIQVRTGISNYSYIFLWGVIITHPGPNFSGGVAKPSLKLKLVKWMSDPIPPFCVDVITDPCPNLSFGLANLY